MLDRCRPLFVGAIALCFVGSALAHDDDPKLRTPTQVVKSKGYRNAWIANPGASTGVLEMGSGGFPASGVALLAWMPLSDFGNPDGGNDCWGYTSPSGREYAIFGHTSGTTFVEISDPTNPSIVGTIPTELGGSGNLWRDIKVYQQYAYAVTENDGSIQVISMANIDSGVVTKVDTITGPGAGSTHNIAVDAESGFLYRCGGGSEGLRIYTLSNPSKPTYVGSWATKYVHDAQVVTYTSGPYAGKQIAFCFDGFNGGWTQPGVDILDVTNKSSIQVLSGFQYPNPDYSHQGWLSEDLQYLYIGDELDEDGAQKTTTYVYDVSDLSSPSYAGIFQPDMYAVGHNMYTKGDVLYQANYRAGLRVLDVSNPTSPSEIGFFDTWPANDNAETSSLWSCFPYFDSGVVIGSDRDSGLFVWWPGDAEVTFAFPGGIPAFVDPAGEDVAVTLVEAAPGAYAPGTAMLHTNDGSGWASTALTDLGGGSFLAPFPAAACGSTFQWYVTAQGASGITWAEPATAPLELYTTLAGLGVTTVASDDMETDAGWTVGIPGDDATTGIWTRVDPNPTAAQPGDDHTPTGTQCWVTGQGTPGGSNGENDVDGGKTTLVSPTYDLSSYSAPLISYWRWYSNDSGTGANNDVFVVEVSNNGSTWVTVEVVGPTGPEVSGGWFEHSFVVSDFVAPTSTVSVRFVASDENAGSIVEAAIDDLRIDDVDCAPCGGTNYCQTAPNSLGGGALISMTGTASIAANDMVLNASGAAPGQPGLFYYGPAQIQVPFGDGFRCVGAGGIGTFRLNPAVTADAFGDVVRPLDNTVAPLGMGPGAVQAGETWNFQFWYRDPAFGGSGFNFSDGLSVIFCP